jgi:DNA-binding MarR family transcriptional regulator
MVASGTGERLEEVAQGLFGLITQFCLAAPLGRRRGRGLKEVEFLTLAILHQHETRIVGDLQRLLGVLPAQMSRIIRSLEGRPEPLIACRINPHDKRKIDVALTPAGERAFLEYQAEHVQALTDLLRHLSDDEREDLVRLLDRLNGALENSNGTPAARC